MDLSAFDLLVGVPEFDGKAEELEMFTKNVDEIRKLVHESLLTLFDLRVRSKIIAKANITLINNNNPTRWEEVKLLLRINFNVTESIESIINKIKTAELRNDVNDLYEYMLKMLTKLNLKTSIDIENEQWYSCRNNENMVLKIFISKLPNEPKLVLNSRNPHNLLRAKEILVETEYFYSKKRNFLSNSVNNDANNFNSRNKNVNNRNRNFGNSFNFNQSLQNNFSQFSDNQNNFGNNPFHRFGQNDRNLESGTNLTNPFSNPINGQNFQNHVANFPNPFNRQNFRNQGNNRNDDISNRGNGQGSQQSSINSSNRMEVDHIQPSNFQLLAEELFPA